MNATGMSEKSKRKVWEYDVNRKKTCIYFIKTKNPSILDFNSV